MVLRDATLIQQRRPPQEVSTWQVMGWVDREGSGDFRVRGHSAWEIHGTLITIDVLLGNSVLDHTFTVNQHFISQLQGPYIYYD